MLPLTLVSVPYDGGRRGWRMGAGPDSLIDGGLPETLRDWGHDVTAVTVEAGSAAVGDPLTAAIELAKGVAREVFEARSSGRFPLVLAGNCVHTLGAVAGHGGAGLGVVWFDAHGDLNTPATSPSGFLDGMALATLLGWCHAEEAVRIPGFRPLPPSHVLLVGARDLDPGEIEAAAAAGVRLLPPVEARSERALARRLDEFTAPLEELWLHLDLDVLDPDVLGPANAFAAPGGLSLHAAIRAVQEAGVRRGIAGMTLSAYDPAVDRDGLVRAAALPLVSEALEEAVASP